MSRFLTTEMKQDIDFLFAEEMVREKIYSQAELYLRAMYKLKNTGLDGTKQEYESKLNSMLKIILQTSSLIESPVEYRFPASKAAIIDTLTSNILNIIDDKEKAEHCMCAILEQDSYRFRRISPAYDEHCNKIYSEDDDEDNYSGVKVTPDEGYEVGYTLVPCATDFIINRIFEDNDLSAYTEHPLFFTNGT